MCAVSILRGIILNNQDLRFSWGDVTNTGESNIELITRDNRGLDRYTSTILDVCVYGHDIIWNTNRRELTVLYSECPFCVGRNRDCPWNVG